jgi:hypothetical protein
MTLKVLDPRLDSEGEALRMAPQLPTLEGSVVALLDNAKIGSERFYDFVAEILQSQYGVREFIRRRKPDTTRPVPKDMLAEMSGADALISGIGD